ncbi:response regulator [Armatimonas sp.]|uniref:response regulator n=1 Tax=Armatimonas sp. TaxID=1872638 RepID=UPI0037510363
MSEPKTILIVDDEFKVRVMLRRHLEAEGYQVVEAENGKVAQKCLREISIDAVFTDYWMPEMDGLELIQWVRQQPEFTSLPIIASCGTPSDSEGYRAVRQPFFDAGCDRFLVRPFSPQELIRWLKELLP